MQSKFIIGTRGSKLALWQAEFVRSRLQAVYPEAEIQLEIIKTLGDKIQNISLTEIGGKGVFTKELETALLEKRIDLAVHSLKDLPTVLPPELHLATVLEREDVRDALVLRSGLQIESPSFKNLPAQAVVGTSSLRRASQLKNCRPDTIIKDIRGNVETRLKKLDAGEYDAILLAVAGLKRLDLENRISAFLDLSQMLPQVGQGALGIETRRDNAKTNALVSVLTDSATLASVLAERAFLRGLGGGCQFPIAAYGMVEQDHLKLEGLVASPDGAQILRQTISGEASEPIELGEKLAFSLLAKGADSLINFKL